MRVFPAISQAMRPCAAHPLAGQVQCPRVSASAVRAQARGPGPAAVALAMVLSVSLHLSAMAALVPRDAVLVQGGGAQAEAAQGNAFADFAEGAIPVAPGAQAGAAAVVVAAPSAAMVPPVVPALTTAAVSPQTPQPPRPAERSDAVMQAPAEPVVEMAPVSSVDPAANPAAPAAQPEPNPLPATAASPVSPSVLESVPEVAVPEVAVREATADTPRPRARAAGGPSQAAGNATQNARRGTAEGREGARAAEAGAGAAASAAGNAAASNYPGEVMRRIQRTRQVRTNARGRAIVGFTVATNGALATVSLQRGSGSAELDRIALDHIRRAAPFPPPPHGAQRAFSFEFVGR